MSAGRWEHVAVLLGVGDPHRALLRAVVVRLAAEQVLSPLHASQLNAKTRASRWAARPGRRRADRAGTGWTEAADRAEGRNKRAEGGRRTGLPPQVLF